MAVIQISKIIMRQGLEEELPGAPVSLDPVVHSPGLDSGEFAFTTDTGRLFIGHDPDEGHVNFDRAQFPYQNIEVLTEYSTDQIGNLIGAYQRAGGSKSFNEATLAASTSWASVIVPREGDATYAYRLNFDNSVTASIEYAVYDNAQKPLKHGVLTVSHFDGESEPSLSDQTFAVRRLDLGSPDNYNASKVFNLAEFRFVVTGSVGSEYLLFQYKNRSGTVLHLRFKTSIPEV